MATCPSDCECDCLIAALETLAVRDDELFIGITDLEAVVTALDLAYKAADLALQSQITVNSNAIAAANVDISTNAFDIAALQATDGFLPGDIRRYDAVAGDQNEAIANSAAFQSALSANGYAYVPEGTWYIATKIVMESGQSIFGISSSLSEIKWDDNNSVITALLSSESVYMAGSSRGVNPHPAYTHHDNISFRDVHFNGNGDLQANENGAINAVDVYGDNPSIERCKISQMRAGINKESFWINFSGTFSGGTSNPTINPRVIDNEFTDNAGQSSGATTAECSLILIGGSPIHGSGDAANISIGAEVSGNSFHDLEQNLTTQLRTVHAIAVFGQGGLVSDNRMYDNTGKCHMVHFNSGDVESQMVSDNYYKGDGNAVNLFRGLVGTNDPDFKKITFTGNRLESTDNCVVLTHHDTWTPTPLSSGVLEDIVITNNDIRSTGSGTAAIALECRDSSKMDSIRIMGNTLDGQSGTPVVHSGFHILLDSNDPLVGAVGTVTVAVADKLIIGNNQTEDASRAVNVAYLNSDTVTINWRLNSDWPDVTSG